MDPEVLAQNPYFPTILLAYRQGASGAAFYRGREEVSRQYRAPTLKQCMPCSSIRNPRHKLLLSCNRS